MTTPSGRDPVVHLTADVAPYIAALARAEAATRRLAVVAVSELQRLTGQYAGLTAAVNAYAAAAGRAAAVRPPRSAPGAAAGPVVVPGGSGAGGGGGVVPVNAGAANAALRAAQAAALAEQRLLQATAATAAAQSRAAQAAAGAAAAQFRVAQAASAAAAAQARASTAAAGTAAAWYRVGSAASQAAAAQSRAATAAAQTVAAQHRVASAAAQAAAAQARAATAAVALGAAQSRAAAASSAASAAATRAAVAAATAQDLIATAAARRVAAEARAATATAAAADASVVASARAANAYRQVGQTSMVAGALLAGGFLLAARSAVRWEADFAHVARVAHESAEGMAALESNLRGLATTMPTSHKEVAEVATAVGQLGVEGVDNMTAFTKTAVQLGVTTNLSSKDAATGLAKLMNITRTLKSEVPQVGSVLVALGNAGAGTESQILDVSTRIAGAAVVARLAVPDIMAIGSTVSSVGIQSEAGGTAIQRVMFRIYDAVNSGGKALQNFAAVAGTDTPEAFAKMFKSDPAGAFLKFEEGLDRNAKAGKNMVGILDELDLHNARDIRTVLSLGAAHEDLAKNIDLARNAWRANIALTDAYNKIAETTAAKITVAKNRINDSAITIGAVLLPAIAAVVDGGADVVHAFESIPGPIRDFLTVLATAAGTAAVFGGVVLIVATRLRALIGAMAQTAVGARVLATALSGPMAMLRATAAILGPVALTVGALYGLAKVGEHLGQAAPDVDAFGLALEKLADTGQVAGELRRVWGENPEGIAADVEASKRNTMEKVGDWLGSLKVFGVEIGKGVKKSEAGLEFLYTFGQGKKNSFDTATEDWAAADAALTKLVGDGKLEQAAKDYERFAAEARKGGESVEDFAKHFPKYAQASAEYKKNTDAAIKATQLFGGALADEGDEFNRAGLDMTKFNADLKDLVESLFGLRDAQDASQSKINELREGLKHTEIDVNALRGSITDTVTESFAGARAHDAYGQALEGLRTSLEGAEKDLSSMRDAVSDHIDTMFAAGRAEDALADRLADLRGDTADTADEMDKLAGAIDKVVDAQFAAANAGDEYASKIAEIRKLIEAPPDTEVKFTWDDPQGLKGRKPISGANLSLAGQSEEARRNRDWVEELVKARSHLIAKEIEHAHSAAEVTAAIARQKQILKDDLAGLGFNTSETDEFVNALDRVPDALEKISGSGDVLSRSLDHLTKDGRANLGKIRDIVDSAGEDIKLQIRPDMSEGEMADIVAAEKDRVQLQLDDMGFAHVDTAPLLNALDGVARSVDAKRQQLLLETGATKDSAAAIRDLVDATAAMIAGDVDANTTKEQLAATTHNYMDQLRTDLANLGLSLPDSDAAALERIPDAFGKAREELEKALPTAVGMSEAAIKSRATFEALALDFAAELAKMHSDGASKQDIQARADQMKGILADLAAGYGLVGDDAARYFKIVEDVPKLIRTNLSIDTVQAEDALASMSNAWAADQKYAYEHPWELDVDTKAGFDHVAVLMDQLRKDKRDSYDNPMFLDVNTTAGERNARDLRDQLHAMTGNRFEITLGLDASQPMRIADEVREKLAALRAEVAARPADAPQAQFMPWAPAPDPEPAAALAAPAPAAAWWSAPEPAPAPATAPAAPPQTSSWWGPSQPAPAQPTVGSFDPHGMVPPVREQFNSDRGFAAALKVWEENRNKGLLRADGGPVTGPGGPREDKVLMWASDGEYVMPTDKTIKYRTELDAMRAGRYADGGVVAPKAMAPGMAAGGTVRGVPSSGVRFTMPIAQVAPGGGRWSELGRVRYPMGSGAPSGADMSGAVAQLVSGFTAAMSGLQIKGSDVFLDAQKVGYVLGRQADVTGRVR